MLKRNTMLKRKRRKAVTGRKPQKRVPSRRAAKSPYATRHRYKGEPKLKKKADRFAFLDVAGLTGKTDVPRGDWNR